MASSLVRLLALLVTSALITGCATGGGVPRPQPFPGARAPADTTPPSEEAQPPSSEAAGSAIIETALALRGIRYANGGSEPSTGFDCSGFVQWVYAQHGALLPREVREQYRLGQRIGENDVQPGDLVFFETVSRGPSHVGIALGSGEFVHAPSSRGVVRVERYTSSYWSSRWLGARRISVAE